MNNIRKYKYYQTAPTPAHLRIGTTPNDGYLDTISLKRFLAVTVDSIIASALESCLINLCTWSTCVEFNENTSVVNSASKEVGTDQQKSDGYFPIRKKIPKLLK